MTNKSKHKALSEFIPDSLRDPKEARSFMEFALNEYEKDGDAATFLQSVLYASKEQKINCVAGKLAEA